MTLPVTHHKADLGAKQLAQGQLRVKASIGPHDSLYTHILTLGELECVLLTDGVPILFSFYLKNSDSTS